MKNKQSLRQKLEGWLHLFTTGLLLISVLVPAGASADKPIQTALIALNEQDFERAIYEFDRALREARDNNDSLAEGTAHFYMGLVLQRQIEAKGNSHPEEVDKWLRNAQWHYERATQKLPDSSGVWNNLAQIYAREGNKKKADRDKAGEAFRKAISIADERQPLYTVNYADFLAESRKNREDAIVFYDLALEAQPTNERVFQTLLEYFRANDTDRVPELLGKQLERGQVFQAAEAAVDLLENDGRRLKRQLGDNLLELIVRSLTRLCNQPQDFLDTELAKRLAKLGRTDGYYAQPVGEIFSLYQDVFRDEAYEWWTKEASSRRKSSSGKSRLDAFRSLIRALGDRSQRRHQFDRAEAYYMLAFRIDRTGPDGKALAKLADLYVQTNQEEKLRQTESWLESIFDTKGSIYQKMDLAEIFEYHRAIGIIYMHIDQLPKRNYSEQAIYHLNRALRTSANYNEDLRKDRDSKPIVEPELVNLLDKILKQTGQTRRAFELRVETAQNYRLVGRLDAATNVFRPIVNTPVKIDLTEDVRRHYNTLKEDFGRSGFKTTVAPEPSFVQKMIPIPLPIFSPPSAKSVIFEKRSDFGILRLRQPRGKSLSEKEIASLSDQLHSFMADREHRKVDQNRFTFLPDYFVEDVVKVTFDGVQGKVFLDRKSETLEVPFYVTELPTDSNIGPFQAVRRSQKLHLKR